jgi:hypothetical protein
MIIQKENPTIIRIENKEVSEYFKQNFETLWRQNSRTFEGEKEVQQIYTEMLDNIREDDEIVMFAGKPKTQTQADFNVNWCRKAVNKCKGMRMIYYGMTVDKIQRAKKMISVGCKARIVDTTLTVPISNIIFGDTILNSEWETPFAFTTTNKFVAESFRENFEIQWKNAKEIR